MQRTSKWLTYHLRPIIHNWLIGLEAKKEKKPFYSSLNLEVISLVLFPNALRQVYFYHIKIVF